MNKVALDLGFRGTKCYINDRQVLVKSVAGEGRNLVFGDLDMGGDTGDKITVTIDREKLFISDLAIQQSDTVYHSLKADRFDSKVIKALVCSVLGMGFGNGKFQTCIVSGLPVSHYTQYKDDLRNLLLSTHDINVTVGNETIRGTVDIIDGKFIPQPFSACMDRLLDTQGNIQDKSLASKTIAMWDIGFGTTDIYVSNSLTPVEKLSFSTQTAMNHAYRVIANKIEEQFDVTLPLYAIEPIARSGKFTKFGRTYSVQRLVDMALQTTAEQLINEVQNKWKNSWVIDHNLIAGGGGIDLSPYLLNEFANMELLDDAMWAVARGYMKWANRTWGM